MRIVKQSFGETSTLSADLYTLKNDNNMEIQVTNYGCIITAIKTHDKNGNFHDIALGFNTLKEYIKDSPYFGCMTGRYANRISKGEFTLNNKHYSLARNADVNHLHGGLKGFDKVVWNAEGFKNKDDAGLTLKYTSPDGEEGYPGTLDVTLTYTLTNENEIKIDYLAVTDAPTVLNLTNHTYFNLAGEGSGSVLDHIMMINADKITAIDNSLMPTGELMEIAGTPLHFRNPTPLGARIEQDFDQLKLAGGYDHNYILKGEPGSLRKIAFVTEPTTGRVMEVFTTQPAVQLYTGNFLDGTHIGKNGNPYNKRDGFCLETQHYPDSPNHPEFPSTILNPGQTYRECTVYKFSVSE